MYLAWIQAFSCSAIEICRLTSPRVARLGFYHLHGFDRALGCHEHALGATVSERFITFLRSERPAGPLYLEINLEEPHRPYDQGGAVPDVELGVTIPGYLPDDEITRGEMAMLQGAIRQADRGVGRILAALEEAGLTEDALLIFSADHGLAMPRAKCTLYDPGLETALIMRWPRGGLAGARVIREMIRSPIGKLDQVHGLLRGPRRLYQVVTNLRLRHGLCLS